MIIIKKTIFYFFIIISDYIKCDLPVHCLKHQIIGQWKLQLENLYYTTTQYIKCGHSQPDTIYNSYKSYLNIFKVILKFKRTQSQITKNINKLYQKKLKGNWSVLYDQGIIIQINKIQYFTYFKYYPNENFQKEIQNEFDFEEIHNFENYNYDCTETLIGWYTKEHQKGCFKAIKINPNEKDKSISNGHQNKVVQPDEDILYEQIQKQEDKLYEQIQKQDNKLYEQIQKQEDKLYEQVTELNQKNKTWEAGINTIMPNKNTQQRKKGKKKYKYFSLQDLSDLPKEFSLKEYLDEPSSQKQCGSCYVIATVNMLNARLRIKYGKHINDKISMQHILDCSFFSQGCQGGYVYQIGKFGYDYFLISEEEMPYQVLFLFLNQKKFNFFFKGYIKRIFVGGGYGKCNEREMMIEIMKNGPIVASINPDYQFMYYKSGVYHSVEAAEWILNGQNAPEWRNVEHAALCYGWGESEKDGKYWLMQNSWGKEWGENGFFKIRRGTDESSVESVAEYANAEIIYLKKKQKKQKNEKLL
ncbi:hypothetical protein IMG5_001760 [Ichthyophthirius multifiliis]|uniref:Dipeptidyl peptidase 1 n=1 Tax=Ichthyophthirius multifiliis TaxID=5932 RepID=G0QJ06_ICHMU|nr:hypothetical protein IMG5_001760 [Ichthyophthirius multifiliis]EGR34799.1 hypothetical protein IMG5_001760 [Ichthyophthirius multifiliis]|eukprot:XP_004040103.1 hypothetical protein IMG5_001760 [Ichthyophthirius multifiliis]